MTTLLRAYAIRGQSPRRVASGSRVSLRNGEISTWTCVCALKLMPIRKSRKTYVHIDRRSVYHSPPLANQLLEHSTRPSVVKMPLKDFDTKSDLTKEAEKADFVIFYASVDPS